MPILITFTKRNVNVIALIITSIIFLALNYFWSLIINSQESIAYVNEISLNQLNEDDVLSNYTQEITIEESEEKTNEKIIGKIKIPSFNVEALVAEGTSKEIMNQYVGHFENTSKWDGNIGLAAHNRGYPVNYFANVKDLQLGDEVIYEIDNLSRTYIVNKITIVEDTDWSYLQETEDNRITLITCVENEPNYRRCVQAIEKGEINI